MAHTGNFADVVGLTYKTGATFGTTSIDCEFTYNPGEEVTFSIGSLILGSCIGKPLVTISDLVPDAADFDPRLVNRARLLFSLTPGQGFEKAIIIDEKVKSVVAKYASEIDLDSEDLSNIDQPLQKICDELQLQPKSVPHARNHLRREVAGFKVMRDLQIPTPDNGYILADVYLPLQPKGKFPVLVSCTLYGRRVPWSGPDLSDAQDIFAFEHAEDHWHSTPAGVDVQIPDRGPWSEFFTRQRGFENIGTVNTFTYVPSGYAVVRVDPHGVSQTPGKRWAPGEITSDYCAAVEWSAQQSWSTGNVGLIGSSGGANTQWPVAALKPKGLKCFVPYATDIDVYREAAYIGGVPCLRYLENWFARVAGVSPKWGDEIDVESLAKTLPTFSKFWEIQEAHPENSADVPCFVAASQIFMIHSKGAYEAWMLRRPENTHIHLVDCNYYSWPSRESAGKILQFLDYHLKGNQLTLERVGIQMRLGNQAWYWRKERNWPVPGTTYTNLYLTPDGGLSKTQPDKTVENKFSYLVRPIRHVKSGVSFYSSPFKEDVELAGHFTAVLNVSSTDPDADFVVFIWATDESGKVVGYGAHSDDPEPIAKGFLRASHRTLDPKRSVPHRPWHTHKEEDISLLGGADDIVDITIELMPAAARIRKGWQVRVDICPSEEQPDIPGYKAPQMRVWYGSDNKEGINTVHVGGGRTNYIVCPVVPLREGYQNWMH